MSDRAGLVGLLPPELLPSDSGNPFNEGFHSPSHGPVASFTHPRLHGCDGKMRNTYALPELLLYLILMILKKHNIRPMCEISGMLRNSTFAVFNKVFFTM